MKVFENQTELCATMRLPFGGAARSLKPAVLPVERRHSVTHQLLTRQLLTPHQPMR
jgi:hypothetical protein